MAYRILVEVTVTLRTGTLRKKYETMSFVLGGPTRRFAKLNGNLSLSKGLERFLGLA